jgi:methylmalonyl-CoA/ethylmalonyl-CoA epimerase
MISRNFMIKRIHHINFIVHDLEAGIERYSGLLGRRFGPVEKLQQRGVRLARIKLGETWLILVQPVDPNGVPARYLEKHGEGFFLVSLEVDELRIEAEKLSVQGIGVLDSEPRQGLDDWQLMDLDPDDLFGVCVQLVESAE